MKLTVSLSPSRRFFAIVLLASCFAITVGCGGSSKEPKNMVTGKVTLDGKPVAGTVFFQMPDNKEFTGLISLDGTYKIIDAPPGMAKVYIKGGLGGAATPQKSNTPEIKGAAPISAAGGAEPPTKYGSPSTSGLTFEVKGGKQTWDIPLTP
jgi:hypothetical protein